MHLELRWTRRALFIAVLVNLVLLVIFVSAWTKQNHTMRTKIMQYEHAYAMSQEAVAELTNTNAMLVQELGAKLARIEDLLVIQRKAAYTTIKEDHMRSVIRSTLKYMGVYSRDFEELLVFTSCIESEMGRLLYDNKRQALGAFQILPSTEKDILQRWLNSKGQEKLKVKVEALRSKPVVGSAPQLMTDLRYQVALAACNYMMRVSPDKIPNRRNSEAISRFYKKHYNTYLGAATVNGALTKYNLVLNSNKYTTR